MWTLPSGGGGGGGGGCGAPAFDAQARRRSAMSTGPIGAAGGVGPGGGGGVEYRSDGGPMMALGLGRAGAAVLWGEAGGPAGLVGVPLCLLRSDGAHFWCRPLRGQGCGGGSGGGALGPASPRRCPWGRALPLPPKVAPRADHRPRRRGAGGAGGGGGGFGVGVCGRGRIGGWGTEMQRVLGGRR